MKHDQIVEAARECHLVNQLVHLKICFGLQAAVGIVTGGLKSDYCRTIKELVDCGHVSEKWLYLDAELSNLIPLGTRFVLRFLNDERECTWVDGVFIHVLNRDWKMAEDDPRILSVVRI